MLLELELTNVVAAAAISCGLDKRKFIPFDELVGIILNSSPFNAVPKKDNLKPSISIELEPVTACFNESAVKVQRFCFSS